VQCRAGAVQVQQVQCAVRRSIGQDADPVRDLFCALCPEPVLAKGLTLACFIARTGAAASTHTGRGITPAAGRGITPAAVGARPKATEHNLIDSSDEDEEREALLKPGTNSGTNSGRGITPASM